MVGQHSRLPSLLFLLLALSCGTLSQTTSTQRVPTELDLHIAIDSSGSITEEQYAAIKQSVVGFLSFLPVNREEIWVSVRPYSTRAETGVEWTWNTTRLYSEIPDLPRLAGDTRTDTAINDAMYNLIINGRQGVAKAMIIITDGVTRLPSRVDDRRKEAEVLGIGMYTVGFGERQNLGGLLKIAGTYDNIYDESTFLSDLPPDLLSFVRSQTTTSLPYSTTPFNETPFFDTTTRPASAAGTGEGETTEYKSVTTNTPGNIITDAPRGLTTDTPGGSITTNFTDSVTTGVAGRVTSDIPGRVTTNAPESVTTNVPASVTTGASGNAATDVQEGVTTNTPRDETGALGGVTTDAPRSVTTDNPGPETTVAAGRTTDSNPGVVSTDTSGSGSSSIPGDVSTGVPESRPTSSSGDGTRASELDTTSAPREVTNSAGGTDTTSQPARTTTQSIGKAGEDTTVDRIETGDDATTSRPSSGSGEISTTYPTPTKPGEGNTGQGGDDAQNTGWWVVGSSNGNLSAGICGRPEVVLSGGIGYLRHPFSCDQYIQCYPEPSGTLRAVTRQCPVGMFWDERTGVCDKAPNVVCQVEKCKNPEMRDYKMAGNCRAFWRCQDGRSVPTCCDQGFAYFPGRGCVPCSKCTDSCPTRCLSKRVCNKKPDWRSPSAYQLDLGLLGWMTSYCNHGSTFDVTSCSCSSQSMPHEYCWQFLRLSFEGHDAQSSEVRTFSLQQVSGSAVFSGDSALVARSSPDSVRFSKERQLRLRLRYQELLPVAQKTVLVRSSACEASDLMFVYVDQTALYVKLFNRLGEVARTVILTEGFDEVLWKTLELKYSPVTENLTVSVSYGHLTHSTSIRVPMRMTLSRCGWTFGHPEDTKGLGHFKGRMDDIEIAYC